MAGGITKDGDDEAISGINVTPFVDIALVLLIIFMVTAKYIVSQSIRVDLPEARTGEPTAMATVINITIDPQQRLYADTRPVTEAELRTLVLARHAANPEVRAVIAADGSVPHRRVTEVIDLVRQASVTRFAIQTEQPQDPAAAQPR
jgi:biopolymer transport protein TolR